MQPNTITSGLPGLGNITITGTKTTTVLPRLYRTSDGKTYLRTVQSTRYRGITIHRCTPEGHIIPRIRMSKKTRKKLIKTFNENLPQESL